MFRSHMLAFVSVILLAGLNWSCSTGNSGLHPEQMQERQTSSTTSALKLPAFEDCDIDIRPLEQKENPQQHLFVKYLPHVVDSTGPTVQTISIRAKYEPLAEKFLAVHDSNDVFLGNLAHDVALRLNINWPATHSDTVAVKGGANPSSVTPGGCYLPDERLASPCFEKENPPGEKVRIKCQYRGRTIALIVKHVDRPRPPEQVK